MDVRDTDALFTQLSWAMFKVDSMPVYALQQMVGLACCLNLSTRWPCWYYINC